MPDCATVDHIKDRRQCLTVAEHRARSNAVLACYRCNYDRAVKLDRERLEEKRRRWAEYQASIGDPLKDLTEVFRHGVTVP